LVGWLVGWVGVWLTCLCLPAAGGHLPSAQMPAKVAGGVAKMEKSGKMGKWESGLGGNSYLGKMYYAGVFKQPESRITWLT